MPSLQTALHTYLLIDRAPTTNKQYYLVLTKLVSAIGPARDVGRVTHEDLLDYFADLRARLKPATITNYTAITKAFFAWCVKRSYIDRSPAAGLVCRKPQRDPSKRMDVPGDELALMVEFARTTSPRNHALMLFLVDTGCRVGGAASLQIKHLHLDTGLALIQEKGGRWVKVRFGGETASVLQRWLTVRPTADHDYIWTGKAPRYAPLKPASISAVVASLARRVGASQPWRGHSVRHAVGHAYAHAGAPLTLTQRKLNHADPLITARYYYPDSDADLEVVSERLSLAPLRSAKRTGT